MFVAIARFTMFLTSQPHSLKEKRSLVNKLKDALKNRLHVSVAEVDQQDLWQKAVLGVACVTSDKKLAEKTLSEAHRLLESFPEVEITQEERDVECW